VNVIFASFTWKYTSSKISDKLRLNLLFICINKKVLFTVHQNNHASSPALQAREKYRTVTKKNYGMLFRPINVYNFILSLAAILPKQILKTINYETAFLFLNTRFIYTDQFEQEKKCMNLLNRHMPCGFSHSSVFHTCYSIAYFPLHLHPLFSWIN